VDSNSVKALVKRPEVQARFTEVLGRRGNQFAASIVSLVNATPQLRNCDPNTVLASCMTAATLDLPIHPALGLAYIVPFKSEATFQIGYKGLIQLAIRSGQYRYLNACPLYEGQLQSVDKLTGAITLNAEAPDQGEVIGYVASLQLNNGFRHAVFWKRQEVENHAVRFSASFKSKSSPWQTDFDAMALKTVLKALLTKWGILSVELQNAITSDNTTDRSGEQVNVDIQGLGDDPEDDSEKGNASLGPTTKNNKKGELLND
jgi:recombination protein RecT